MCDPLLTSTVTGPLNISEPIQRCRGHSYRILNMWEDQLAETHQKHRFKSNSIETQRLLTRFFLPSFNTNASSILGSNQQNFTSDKSGEVCVSWAPRCDTDFGRPARAAQSFYRIKPQQQMSVSQNWKIFTRHKYQNYNSHYYNLLLWEFGQWAAKSNHR